jgi:hypothetical protein
MTNDKAEMSNQAQNPKDGGRYFWHLDIWMDFSRHLDFHIWNLFKTWGLESRVWSGATVGDSSAS